MLVRDLSLSSQIPRSIKSWSLPLPAQIHRAARESSVTPLPKPKILPGCPLSPASSPDLVLLPSPSEPPLGRSLSLNLGLHPSFSVLGLELKEGCESRLPAVRASPLPSDQTETRWRWEACDGSHGVHGRSSLSGQIDYLRVIRI